MTCDREQDVLDAVAAGRWPERCGADLRGHVNACAVCADLADVAVAVVDDREQAWTEASIPSAGLVWWRAQLRAREDAARAAGRPVAFIQGVAASVAVWLIVSLLRALPSGYFSAWRAWVSSALPAVTMHELARVTATVPLVVFVVVAVWLVLAPVAIYFAAADE
ncbi:MAG TPA: hypothetical protein VL882_24185 [Vicinamibacterales bacterium]|jgi:hypothetical protein|nr:hypothetical protein [Vicinamibacterales bacterium]